MSPCDLAQVDNLILQANTNGHGIVQVDNLFLKTNVNGRTLAQVDNIVINAPAHCDDVAQVENVITSTHDYAQCIDLVQVDPLYSTSAHDGTNVVQVVNSDNNASANGIIQDQVANSYIAISNGSDSSQVLNSYTTSATEGGSLVQVDHSLTPTKFQREGPLMVNRSRGIKRKRS